MSTKKKIGQFEVLTKAFNNACEALVVGNTEKSKLLSGNKSISFQNIDDGFHSELKEREIQLQFIKLHRSLFTISGGDSEFMYHWFNTENNELNGIPSSICLKVEGVYRINQYLDVMQSTNRVM